MQFTTGGNAAVLLTGFLLTTLAASALYSSISGAYSSNCHWEPYIKEIKTPIYDAYGKHIANNVDTYQDYRWVCV